MERLTYTVSEVAGLLGLSRSKAYELVASGAIPALAIPGRRKLVTRATLWRLVEQPPSDDPPTTPHDAHDHDADVVHGPFTRPLPSRRSQPRHSPHTDAPGVPGRSRPARGG